MLVSSPCAGVLGWLPDSLLTSSYWPSRRLRGLTDRDTVRTTGAGKGSRGAGAEAELGDDAVAEDIGKVVEKLGAAIRIMG